jgi:hypothetical protein
MNVMFFFLLFCSLILQAGMAQLVYDEPDFLSLGGRGTLSVGTSKGRLSPMSCGSSTIASSSKGSCRDSCEVEALSSPDPCVLGVRLGN